MKNLLVQSPILLLVPFFHIFHFVEEVQAVHCQTQGEYCCKTGVSGACLGTCTTCFPCTGVPGQCYGILQCDSNSMCVPCLSQADCGVKACINGECFACTSNTECGMPKPICKSLICVECSLNIECTSTTASKCVNNICGSCQTDSDCTQISGFPLCFLGVCVQCKTNTQCTSLSATPFCFNNVCSQCKTNSECPTVSAPKCQSGTCSSCTSNFDCTLFPSALICGGGICVQCATNADCLSKTSSKCSGNACSPCVTTADCGQFGALICVFGTCAECQFDSDCNGLTPFCSNFICVQCTNNTQCSSISASHCVNNVCTPCQTNQDCSHLTLTPACNSPVQTCTLCVTNQDCAQNPNIVLPNPFCDITNKCQTCLDLVHGCQACAADNGCQTIFIPVCNTNTNLCEPCSNNTGCLHLTPFEYCLNGSNSSTFCASIDAYFNRSSMIISADINTTIQVLVSSVTQVYSIAWSISPSFLNILKISNDSVVIPSFSSNLNGEVNFILTANVTSNASDFKIVTMKIIVPVSDSTLSDLYKTAQSISIAASGFAGVILSFGVGSGALNLFRALFYVYFFNADFSYNLDQFLALFSSTRLNFLPNILLNFDVIANSDSITAPPKFQKQGYNGLFLLSAGPTLMYIGLVIAVGNIAKLIHKIGYGGSIVMRITDILKMNSGWSGFLNLWIMSYSEFTISGLLQITTMDFSNLIAIISTMIGCVVFFFNLYLPYSLWTIFRGNEKKRDKIFERLVEDFNTKHKINKLFPWIYVIKSGLMSSALVLAYDTPSIQITTGFLCTAIYVGLILKYKPWKEKWDNYINIIEEFLFMIIYFTIEIYVSDMSKDRQDSAGWAVISLACIVIFIQLVSIAMMVKDLFSSKLTKKEHYRNKKREFRRKDKKEPLHFAFPVASVRTFRRHKN